MLNICYVKYVKYILTKQNIIECIIDNVLVEVYSQNKK